MKAIFLSLLISLLLVSCNKNKSSDNDHSNSKAKSTSESHEGHDHAEGEHKDGLEHDGHDHGEHAHSENEEVKISEQALKNMGVKIKAVDSGTFTVYRPVPALVMESPLSEQPVFSPFGGRVKSINITLGEHKKPGEALVTIYRDPIKRPELKMVEEILSPASEEFHGAITSLRQNLTASRILKEELNRLQKFQKDSGSLALIPQKDLINLRYEIDKADRAVENSRKKLELHGLNEKDIEHAKQGTYKIDLYQIWKNTLKANNIWNKSADSLLASLGTEKPKNRWVIASIGELVAEDLLSKDLIEWIAQDKEAADHFLEIVSLLQDGRTISDLKALHVLGAFKDVIEIKAPANKAGWDIESIHVKIGQKISDGEKVLTLSDQSNIYLVSYPQSSEVVDIIKAVESSAKMKARPLSVGSSPNLTNLQIDKIRGKEDGREEVLISTNNSILKETKKGDRVFRSWSLRDGQKYIVELPFREIKDVILLPLSAVIKHGPDQIVFVKENDEYIRRRVVVVYQNNEVAVIGQGSELLPQENMVISGAFALQLALIAGTPEAVDPHAGHNH